MTQKKDTFSTIMLSKTGVLCALVAFLIIYSIVSTIIIFSNTNFLLMITKILLPLVIIGVSTFIAVDCYHKMTSSEKPVQVFGLITLIIGTLNSLLLILLVWEVIPALDRISVGSYSILGYTREQYATVPSAGLKCILTLSSITGFTFLGSIILNAKNNHRIVKASKYTATFFLGLASLLSIVCIYIDYSKDPTGSMRLALLQAVFWITAISLGAAVFYLSKTVAWEEKEYHDFDIDEKPLTESVYPDTPAKPVAPATIIANDNTDKKSEPNPMDQIEALDPTIPEHTVIRPIDDDKQ